MSPLSFCWFGCSYLILALFFSIIFLQCLILGFSQSIATFLIDLEYKIKNNKIELFDCAYNFNKSGEYKEHIIDSSSLENLTLHIKNL